MVDPFAKNSNRGRTPLPGRSGRCRCRPSLSAHRIQGASPPAARPRAGRHRTKARDGPQNGGQGPGLAGAWEKIIVDATPVNDVMSAVVDRVLECHEIKELRKECGRLRRENERLRSERRSRVEQRALQTAAVVYLD